MPEANERLREHAITLLELADEERLAKIISMLEGAVVSRSASPAMGHDSDDDDDDDDDDESSRPASVKVPSLKKLPSAAGGSPNGGLHVEGSGAPQRVASNLFGANTSKSSPPVSARKTPRTARSTVEEGGPLLESRDAIDPADPDAKARSATELPAGSIAAGAVADDDAADEGLEPVAAEEDSLATSKRGNNKRRGVCAVPVGLQDVRAFQPRVVDKSDKEKEELRAVVETNSLFTSLEPRDLEQIVMAFDRQEFNAGVDILKQGETSPSRFYLISEGQISVIKSGKNVAKMAVGQTFGELEMMYDSSEPNAATCRAVTDLSLWWLDRPTYKNIVLRATLEKRELYLSLLGRVKFLEGMSEYDKNQLADALTSTRFRDEDQIIKFGEKGNWMHFIVEGTVQIVGRKKGAKVNIIQLGEGECVGELEFLFNHLTVADVVAVGPVTTAKLSRKHFEMLMGPISNDIKRYIANGNYDYYLKENPHALEQIQAAEKKAAARTNKQGGKGGTSAGAAAAQAVSFSHEFGGELVVAGQPNADSNDKDADDGPAGGSNVPFYRFPIRGAEQATGQLMVGIREDGTIATWNRGMEELTKYKAADVIGQSIFSYLSSLRDQKEMNDAVSRATQFAGDPDGFFAAIHQQNADAEAGVKHDNENGETVPVQPVFNLWTFARADGLTKSTVQFSVLPPVVEQGGGRAEVVLAVGTERKRRPQTKDLDAGEWLAEQLRDEIATISKQMGSGSSEPPTSARGESTADAPAMNNMQSITTMGDLVQVMATLKGLTDKFDKLNTRNDDDLHAVNVRTFLGNAVSQCQGDAMAKQNTFEQVIDDGLPTELFLDMHAFPEVLKYALGKAAKHCTNQAIKITAKEHTESGLDYFSVSVFNKGSSIDARVLRAYQKASAGNAPEWFANSAMNKARQGLAKLGGHMLLASKKNEWTEIILRVPLIPSEEADADDEFGENTDLSMSVAKKQNKLTFTTLVVEERPVHRNALNTALWERKHAVMPANTAQDVRRLLTSCDIAVVDPQQGILAGENGGIPDPVQFLRGYAATKAIIITSDSFDDQTREAYHKTGFFTLTKPCTPIQAKAVFRKAEEMVAKFKAEENKIEAMRDVFSGAASNMQRAPWEKGRLLGKGAFGEVFEAIDTMTGGKMAVKILRIGPKVDKKEVLNEIETMCTLRHKNIIHYFYAEDATPPSTTTNVPGLERVGSSVASGPSTVAAGGGDTTSSAGGANMFLGGPSTEVDKPAVFDVMGGGAGPAMSALDTIDSVQESKPSFLHVFMEFASGGTLDGKLAKLNESNQKMTTKDMVPILRDILEGLCYVHDQRFVHCDIKSANVLFGFDGRAKLGDFGTARRLKEGEKFYYMQGTPSYMSPECMSADPDENIGYDFKTDMWSFGMMVLEMATGKPPLSHIPGLNSPYALTKYVTELADAPDLSVIFDAPVPLFELIRACVDVDPDKRPTAAQALEFAMFRDDTSEDLQSAMKALKRAQLLHMLNQFVAFYDEEEEEEKRKLQQKSGAGGNFNSDDDDGSDGGFFDSSDDDDDALLDRAGDRASSMSVMHRDSSVVKAGNVDAFFSSDDEVEPDDDDEAKKKPPAVTAPTPAIPEQGEDDDDDDGNAASADALSLLPALTPRAPENGKPTNPRPHATPPGQPGIGTLPAPTVDGPLSSSQQPASAASFTTAAVALHEALLNFLDRANTKYGMNVDVSDARARLRKQYEDLQQMAADQQQAASTDDPPLPLVASAAPAAPDVPPIQFAAGAAAQQRRRSAQPLSTTNSEGNLSSAATASPGIGATSESPPARARAFQPDAAKLLHGDTELLSRLSNEMAQVEETKP